MLGGAEQRSAATTPRVALARNAPASTRPSRASSTPEHLELGTGGDEGHQQRVRDERHLDQHPHQDRARRQPGDGDGHDEQRGVADEGEQLVGRRRDHDQHEPEHTEQGCRRGDAVHAASRRGGTAPRRGRPRGPRSRRLVGGGRLRPVTAAAPAHREHDPRTEDEGRRDADEAGDPAGHPVVDARGLVAGQRGLVEVVRLLLLVDTLVDRDPVEAVGCPARVARWRARRSRAAISSPPTIRARRPRRALTPRPASPAGRPASAAPVGSR